MPDEPKAGVSLKTVAILSIIPVVTLMVFVGIVSFSPASIGYKGAVSSPSPTDGKDSYADMPANTIAFAKGPMGVTIKPGYRGELADQYTLRIIHKGGSTSYAWRCEPCGWQELATGRYGCSC